MVYTTIRTAQYLIKISGFSVEIIKSCKNHLFIAGVGVEIILLFLAGEQIYFSAKIII